MIEQIKRVMEQIIVPRYENVDYVEVYPLGSDDSLVKMVYPLDSDDRWFKIVYYFTPPLEHKDAIEIMEETAALYKMFGFKGGDIIVSFEKVKK